MDDNGRGIVRAGLAVVLSLAILAWLGLVPGADPGRPGGTEEPELRVTIASRKPLTGRHVAVLVARDPEGSGRASSGGDAAWVVDHLESLGAAVTMIGPGSSPESPGDYSALIILGGWGDGRTVDTAVTLFVSAFAETGRLTAAFGDGIGVLLAARVIQGLSIAPVEGMDPGLVDAAGAIVADQPLILSNNILTAGSAVDVRTLVRRVVDILAAQGI